MTTLLRTAGDKLLGALAPKRRASACQWPSYCAFQYMGCGGGQCYYYYQKGNWCYVGMGQLTDCLNAYRKWQGCC